MFLEKYKKRNANATAEEMADVLQETIDTLREIQEDNNITDSSHLNLVISSGRNIVATRYLCNPEKPDDTAKTLYYAEGTKLYTTEGTCHIPKEDNETNSVLVVSEKLDDHVADWTKIESNQMLIIRDDLTITQREIKS